MSPIVLNSLHEFDLKSENLDDITVTQVTADNFQDLLCPIKVISDYPSELFPNSHSFISHRETMFNISQYITVYHRQPTTGPMRKTIRNCKYKKLQIALNNNTNSFNLRFFYIPAIFKIEEIIIHVGKQNEGYTYSLHPKSIIDIRHSFPDAIVSSPLLIPYNVKVDFELMNGPVFPHVIAVLTGLSSQELDDIKQINFIDPLTKKNIYSSYYEQEEG